MLNSKESKGYNNMCSSGQVKQKKKDKEVNKNRLVSNRLENK